ncbi:MerR family transcriptional regulator [Bacillus sp. M6-12]|uniref:MerR family transcriptional regulator n=1 Tax=Bacillus sp. M6-12 TaxID=2054166 RepID=UPI000C790A79|nr:MerR family transcriptional regulator [Bacillus sp. M6-12]PLS16378.1 MerR family transcriptional regulator [Bacillus sp. M6-12]
MQEGKYNIKAISKLLGIQPGTLRAWERRYQLISPVRNESGHRLYTEEHVKILRWLISKTSQGFSISQAVSLFEQGRKLAAENGEEAAGDTNQIQLLKTRLLDSFIAFNETKSHELINQAFALYTADLVIMDILRTIMADIEQLRETGDLTSAHEHFASSIIRARVTYYMHTIPSHGFLPKALAVCGPDERHDFELLILTFFLRRKGLEVVYLGHSVTEADLKAAIGSVNPRFLFVSCTVPANLEKTLTLAEDFKRDRPDLQIGLSGLAFTAHNKDEKVKFQNLFIGNTKHEWDQWIERFLMLDTE